MRRWSPSDPLVRVGFLALLLVLAGLLPVALGSLPAGPGTQGRATGGSIGPGASGGPTPLPGTSAGCDRPSFEYPALWGSTVPPPAVAPTSQMGCVWGGDESALSFLSNRTGAGERVLFSLTLPGAGAAVATTLAALSFRLWTGGVPCAAFGATLLDVELLPPGSPYAANFSADWSVATPAYSLVPPGSCVPTCTNDTALFTFDGARFCQEQVLRSGLAATVPTPGPAPGDSITLTFVGASGSGAALTVYLNDSSRPGANLRYTYDSTSTVTGRPLAPLYAASNLTQSVWGMSPGVSVAATLCPLAGTGGAGCFSYNRTTQDAVGPLTIAPPLFWDPTNLTYDGHYDAVAPASSTGSCATGPIACSGFGGPSGGFYPFWGLGNASAGPVWQFGDPTGPTVRAYGGVGRSDGGSVPTFETSMTLWGLAEGVTSTSLWVRGTLVDPSGIRAIQVTSLFCEDSSGVASAHASAALVTNLFRTTFNVSFLTYPSYGGTYPVWVQGLSSAGRLGGPWIGSVTDPIGAACTFSSPPSPTLNASNVTAISGGYRLHWAYPSPAAIEFRVNATDPSGGLSSWLVEGTSTTWTGGSPGVSYNLTVAAVDPLGTASAPSPAVLGAPVRSPLILTIVPPFSPAWWPLGALLNLSGNVSGGTAPYSLHLSPGDGTSVANVSLTGNFTLLHNFGAYWGTALGFLTVRDAANDSLSYGPMPVTVYATPLGPIEGLVAGDSVVNASASLLPSPAAPSTGFVYVWTSNASIAWELGRGDTSNLTVPGVSVWNSTLSYHVLFPTNGVAVFVQVLARNPYGLSMLEAGTVVPSAVPAPLVLGPIQATAGGHAPFTDNVSATLTSGTNDSLQSASYSYAPATLVPATILDLNGTFYLNASLSFPSPGTFVVVLHAVDRFYDVAIGIASVYVAPGLPPPLAIQLLAPPAYAGSPLAFQGTVGAGSGSYLWNWSFGDGNYSSVADPTHVYALSGAYTVLVQLTDLGTGGVNTTTLPLTVFALPVAFVSVTAGPNGSLSYDFHASVGGGSGPSTVLWTFGDGSVARGTDVTHDYRFPGTYQVNVTVSDPAGRAGTTDFNLTANAEGGGGGGGGGGLTELDLTLGVTTAAFAVLALLLAVRRGGPPTGTALARPEEDGEVSLT